MSSFTRNSLIVVGLLVVAFALIQWVKFSIANSEVQLVATPVNIPFELGSWQGKEFPVSEDVYEILETDSVFLREYRDKDGYPVVLAIVFANKIRGAFHPPEICYAGSGLELVGKDVEAIDLVEGTSLRANKLLLESAPRQEAVTAWYWYTAGEQAMPSFYRQQLHLLKDLILQKPLRGMLVRVSVQEHSEIGKAKAYQFMQDFGTYLTGLN